MSRNRSCDNDADPMTLLATFKLPLQQDPEVSGSLLQTTQLPWLLLYLPFKYLCFYLSIHQLHNEQTCSQILQYLMDVGIDDIQL